MPSRLESLRMDGGCRVSYAKPIRRKWLSLGDYQHRYGQLLAYKVPETRPDARSCLWCHKPLPSKRNKSFCCPDCSAGWGSHYVWGRTRAPVSWKIVCRDKFTCQDCGFCGEYINDAGVTQYTDKGFEVHHIVPVCEGGVDHESNLVTLCKRCHIDRHRKLDAGVMV